MQRFTEKIRIPFEIVGIISKIEPLYLVFSFSLIVIDTMLAVLSVYLPKYIIECLEDRQKYTVVLFVVILYVLMLLTLRFANTFLRNKRDLKAASFSIKLKKNVGRSAMRIELKDIENPQMNDAIRLAGHAAELTGSLNTIEAIISDIVSIFSFVWIISRLDIWFILIVAIPVVAKTIFVRITYQYNKKYISVEAENDRFGDYLNYISYFDQGAEKEIRINNLQSWFMEKVKKYRSTMLGIEYGEYKRTAFFNIVVSLLVAVQSFVLLWLLSRRYISGAITIADFTLYFSAVTALSSLLTGISEKIGRYNRQVLTLCEYKNLIEVVKNVSISYENASTDRDIPRKNVIEFCDVSFVYPNSKDYALIHINLTISDKEHLVIVGANGSGKSTLIKLLCKFYHPTSGKITLNGTDIWSIPNETYFRVLAAVFQDFTNFAFSINENIAMDETVNESEINRVLDIAGLSVCVQNFKHKGDTFLTNQFDPEGIELSGGQAQKLAIARAIYKNAPILILDEPTANLDPQAESEIYTSLFNSVKDKTAIFISHRMAAVSVADNIAVFKSGKIIEYGTHGFLMEQNQDYAEMYKKQSSEYADAEKY